MAAEIFDATNCILGEGVLWHPLRQELFWFDILDKKLHAKGVADKREWQFNEHVSAAGWVDEKRLLIASETSLSVFEIPSGNSTRLTGLEEDNPATRSNDGRADLFGGFWIGTMGKEHEAKAGAIYRFYKGELRKLYDEVTVSNEICFAPDGKIACFTDTRTGCIMRVTLDSQGWPSGSPEIYLDFSGESFGPDGAVIDQDGNLWNAQWGGSKVACFGPQGNLLDELELPTPQATCPGFGEDGDLFVTTAATGRSDDRGAGQTYRIKTGARGQQENRVLL